MAQVNGNRRMVPWLAEACLAARKVAGVNQETIARLAGVRRSAISRFENESPWPEDPDRMVKAYAEACGLDDSRELWKRGLQQWGRFGLDYELPAAEIKPEDFSGALDEYLAKLHQADEASEAEPGEHRLSEGA